MSEDEINLPKDWNLIKDSISDATARKLLSKSGFRVNSAKIEYPKPGVYESVIETMPYVSSISVINENISEEQAAIAAIEQTDPTNFHAIASHMLELSNEHYTSVRIKSEKSFSWSIIAYATALLFFLAAATFFIIHQTNASYFTALGTALAGLFGGLIQVQGNRVDKEAKECRVNLDRIQRFIIVNSACEGLEGPEKKQMKIENMRKLAE